MSVIDELKPCPFCGGNYICVNVGIYIGNSHESVTIKCDDCGASIWGRTEEKAIAAWNRRVQMTATDELGIEELREQNAKLWELVRRYGEYTDQDRCEGCVCKRRCNDDDVDECWQLTEIRELAHELGIEVPL